MFYLKYLPDSRILKYANAGHNWALLLRRDDATCTPLDAEGLVLGVQRDVAFEERSVSLAIGDKLLLYTDGITETQNADGRFSGWIVFADCLPLIGKCRQKRQLSRSWPMCGRSAAMRRFTTTSAW